MLYITSDLHFYHKNIIKYCNRPFSTVEEMNEGILQQFDELPAGSTIFNLGDLFLSWKTSFNDIKLLVDRMKNNNKHLWILLGNHDRTCAKFFKMESNRKVFEELGFERVFENPVELDGYLFMHEPEIVKNKKVVYGHVHDTDISSIINEKVDGTNYFNACWDKHHRILEEEELFR